MADGGPDVRALVKEMVTKDCASVMEVRVGSGGGGGSYAEGSACAGTCMACLMHGAVCRMGPPMHDISCAVI
eukprot:363883-Chlamydomonas_euryale.AAC.13